jgi:hypothetical protein
MEVPVTLVRTRISGFALQNRLLLPEDARLAGAGTERLTTLPGDADVLVLILDMPDAPEGAASVEFTYEHSGHQDPVELTGTRWLRADGTEIEPDDATAAAAAPHVCKSVNCGC